MNTTRVKDNFPVQDNRASSFRLFFARESLLSGIWHIVDQALWKDSPDGALHMALHGKFITVADRCDTVLQAKLRLVKESDAFCARCLEEFELAKETIAEKNLLQFK